MNIEMPGLTGTAGIFNYHKALLDSYGIGTAAALGWMQPEGQQARFNMLSRIGDMSNRSVLDAGCGYADLFAFLRNQYPSVTYHGCEQIPDLLNVAAQRYKGEKGIRLYLGDFLQTILPETDYVLASGSLNYRHPDENFIYTAIASLYAKCRIGLCFNLLSGDMESGSLLVSYNKEQIIGFCCGLSDKVELHTGYWEDDFTVFMYR